MAKKAVIIPILLVVVAVMVLGFFLLSGNLNLDSSNTFPNDVKPDDTAKPDDAGLVIGQMATEEVKITNVDFPTSNTLDIALRNTGSTAVTISEIRVVGSAGDLLAADVPIEPNADGHAVVTLDADWANGYAYQIRALSTKGNVFVYTATAPAA